MTKLATLSVTLFAVMKTCCSFSSHDASKISHVRPTQCALMVSEHSETEQEPYRKKRRCGPCPEPASDDIDMDRREAAFAMLGSLWAMGAVPMFRPEPASATYGADAKMQLPNVMEGISDRVNKQCIVESLGNRECLLYMDPANKIYQGVDNQVLLERLEKSSAALATLPELIQDKKWSKVVGVMTGPMGTLGNTMDQLIKVSGNAGESADMAKKVKTDLYAIAGSADRKDVAKALANQKMATEHLVAFAKSL